MTVMMMMMMMIMNYVGEIFLATSVWHCQHLDYIPPNCRMTDELKRTWKEAVVA
jgi:hypothetical protein